MLHWNRVGLPYNKQRVCGTFTCSLWFSCLIIFSVSLSRWLCSRVWEIIAIFLASIQRSYLPVLEVRPIFIQLVEALHTFLRPLF
jgi:hypothetical protein